MQKHPSTLWVITGANAQVTFVNRYAPILGINIHLLKSIVLKLMVF